MMARVRVRDSGETGPRGERADLDLSFRAVLECTGATQTLPLPPLAHEAPVSHAL